MITKSAAISSFLLVSSTHAFVGTIRPSTKPTIFFGAETAIRPQRTVFRAAFRLTTRQTLYHRNASSLKMTTGRPELDDEIQRLRAQAAKLRAEAAALEAEKAEAMARAADNAFRTFDTNQDGEISLQELKEGLERLWKTELSESRVKELMKAFDASGDGSLKLEEFVTVDKFRNKLDSLVREEKEFAVKAKREADEEAIAAKFAEAKLELLNDRPPSGTDKFISILPYLFPLMDGLQYGRFLLGNEDGSNPLVAGLAILYTLYRSIPFSGFVAFFALNFLSFNPKINRLVRFNMQQAIYLDIALFFPGLLLGISQAVNQGLGLQIPPSFTEVASDVVFFTMLAVLTYTTISSLLGITPDKLPIVSKAANDRMPSLDMLDDQGRFIGRQQDEEDKDKKD